MLHLASDRLIRQKVKGNRVNSVNLSSMMPTCPNAYAEQRYIPFHGHHFVTKPGL